jgi:hypothetical protein
MGERYFKRKARLVVGTLDVSLLDFKFQIKKSIKAEPNSLDLVVFNLSEDSRTALESFKGSPPVELLVGYEDTTPSLIYYGEAEHVWSSNDGADIITTISAGDGTKAAKARVNQSIGAATPPDIALRAIAGALGVKPGNLESAVATLKRRGLTLYPHGTALSGNAMRELIEFCRAADLEPSIQDGKLLILEKGKATQQTSLYFSSGAGKNGGDNTGIVGQASLDSKGLLNFRVLISPDLQCGRLVVIDSRTASGTYRLEEIKYSGDTAGSDWYADCTARKVTTK